MTDWDRQRAAQQRNLVDARHHLEAVEQWAGNATSMAESSPQEQAAAAIFAQVATARAIAALAAAVLEIGTTKRTPGSSSS
jgi:hypothetical protein